VRVSSFLVFRTRELTRRKCHSLRQTMQHLSHFDGSADMGRVIVQIDYSGVPCDHRVPLELGGGIGCVTQETAELTPAFLSTALDDVCGNGHRGSIQLTAYCRVLLAADSVRQSMYSYREDMCLAPDKQLSEVAHTSYLHRPHIAPTSFSRNVQHLSRPYAYKRPPEAPAVVTSFLEPSTSHQLPCSPRSWFLILEVG